jgi:hypothetical protein
MIAKTIAEKARTLKVEKLKAMYMYLNKLN